MFETLGKLKDFRDRMGAWFAALTAIAGGILLLAGPAEIAEEIKYPHEIGIVCLGLGVLIILSLSLRGSAGYRARSLLFCLIATLVGGGLGWWSEGTIRDIWALHERGEVRRVQVVGSTMRQNPKTRNVTRLTQVMVAGERVSPALDGNPRRGEIVEVLVAADRPTAVVPGEVSRDWLALVDARVGRWFALLIVAVLLVCVVAIPVSLWNALTGPRP